MINKRLTKNIIILLILVLTLFSVYSQINDDLEKQQNFSIDDLSFSTNKNGVIKINIKNSPQDYYLGFAISGRVNNQPRLVTIEDYNWTWEKTSYNVTRQRYNQTTEQIDNITFTITNLTAANNNSQLIWKQQYIFDPERPPKLSHIITNNIGRDITDATFWFVFKLPKDFKLRYNGSDFIINDSNVRMRNTPSLNLSRINPIIDLREIEFIYADLLNNKFVISDFYVGNGSIVGHPETLIGAIGVTKGNSILANGETITLDPEVTSWKNPTRSGQFYNAWSSGTNILVSDDARAVATTNGLKLGTDLYGFDNIPADAEITGIEIRVEARLHPSACP